ncbi:SpoIID/LytB domain-containing protein [Geomobilimonas luticola]|uniref:SpoIID/LytB domain-containing protein n=1 Tax=Geomobilimonas luticola TaxID=1114878 RepID=UPI001FE4894D|nr:SpoIID/LytB domain-containing protein [Geomobilimonas luticola]
MKLLIAILFCICFFHGGVGRGEPLQTDLIRVALQKGSDAVSLDGTGVLALADDGEPLRLNLPLQVKRVRDGLAVNGRTVRKLVASAPAFLLINGKGYRGTIEITPSDKGLLVVNELPLDEYLVGLINCEISSQWPMEAVKAQAVIARSYAVYQRQARKNAPYHLESSVLDQVYEGCDIEDSRAARGVQETAGEVLSYDGGVIQAFYHSNCGGHTEASENVWGFPLPYLRGVDCAYCETAPSLKWEQTLPLRRIESQLKNSGFQVAGLKDIRLGRRNASGRLVDLTLVTATGRQTIPATRFRMAVGSTIIKSTNFEVRIAGENALFSGAGYGHGVGLCQWGAKQRASDGFDYREILSYYYPGTRLARISGD